MGVTTHFRRSEFAGNRSESHNAQMKKQTIYTIVFIAAVLQLVALVFFGQSNMPEIPF